MFNKIASTFLVKTIVAFINLAIVVLLSQLIGAEGKGEASIVLTSIAMVLLFTNIIGGPTLIYFVPRHNAFFLFLISNVWSIITCFIAYFVLIHFKTIPSDYVLPVVLLSLINSFLTTNTTILYGKEKINQANLILLIQAIVNIAILALFIINFNQKNVFAYINSLYITYGLCFIISFIMVKNYLVNINFSNSKKIIYELSKLGIINQLGHFLKFMSFRFIYYIIVRYSITHSEGEGLVGIFSNCNSITEAVLLITNSYISVIHPRISNSTDNNYSANLTLKYTKHSTILCALALLILILFPDSFWLWLFGNDFVGLRNIIIMLCPGILFYNIALITGHYFSGTGRPQINTIANLIGLITTFGFIYFIIPGFNLTQIAVISSLSYLTTTIVIVIYFLRDTKFSLFELFPSINDIKDLKNDIFLLLKK